MRLAERRTRGVAAPRARRGLGARLVDRRVERRDAAKLALLVLVVLVLAILTAIGGLSARGLGVLHGHALAAVATDTFARGGERLARDERRVHDAVAVSGPRQRRVVAHARARRRGGSASGLGAALARSPAPAPAHKRRVCVRGRVLRVAVRVVVTVIIIAVLVAALTPLAVIAVVICLLRCVHELSCRSQHVERRRSATGAREELSGPHEAETAAAAHAVGPHELVPRDLRRDGAAPLRGLSRSRGRRTRGRQRAERVRGPRHGRRAARQRHGRGPNRELAALRALRATLLLLARGVLLGRRREAVGTPDVGVSVSVGVSARRSKRSGVLLG